MTQQPQKCDRLILVADDDPAHNEDVAWRLRHDGFDVETVASGRACLDALMCREYDALLLDMNLGDMSGIDVLMSIRKMHAVAQLPVIMVTADACSELTVRALQEGANDFVPKPVDLDVAVARLRTQLDLRSATERLEHRALYDQLTGLPNRTLLVDRLNSAFARATRTRLPLAILLLDLDGFKAVNDRHGHVVGDRLLTAVARRLADSARKVDTVGRLGGDEFVVLAESIRQQAEVNDIAKRLEQTVNRPFEIDGHRIQIGVSIGSHLWTPDGIEDFDALVSFADAAMYKVKHARKAS